MSNNSIARQLSRLNLSKVKMDSGRTVVDELKHHAGILANCITYELDKVYDGYTPKVWKRDYSLYNSICVDDFVEIRTSSSGAKVSIGIHFDSGAYHQSFDGRTVNVAYLLNEGWQWRNGANIPYLSWRDGTHFIEKGIARYKKSVCNPFTVRFIINNEERIF